MGRGDEEKLKMKKKRGVGESGKRPSNSACRPRVAEEFVVEELRNLVAISLV